MLCSYLGRPKEQEAYVQAAGVALRIKTEGMTVNELGLAASRLFPELTFWSKNYATLSELSKLVNQYNFPVGVEWQGIFDNPDDDESSNEDSDDDPGHYSVITGISTEENWLTLADPYRNRGFDKQLTILEFVRRWWDINIIINPRTGKHEEVDDYHTLFIITPNNGISPSDLNLTPCNPV